MRAVLMTAIIALSLLSVAASAADAPAPGDPSFVLTIKDHVFAPQQLNVPANQKIKITVKNLDATPAEFESEDFQAEKVIPANGEGVVYIAPLKAGSYEFYDDFHEDDTKGTLIAQ